MCLVEIVALELRHTEMTALEELEGGNLPGRCPTWVSVPILVYFHSGLGTSLLPLCYQRAQRWTFRCSGDRSLTAIAQGTT